MKSILALLVGAISHEPSGLTSPMSTLVMMAGIDDGKPCIAVLRACSNATCDGSGCEHTHSRALAREWTLNSVAGPRRRP